MQLDFAAKLEGSGGFAFEFLGSKTLDEE